MESSTKRALPQIITRHTPGSLIPLDDFNVFVRVRAIEGVVDDEVNKEILLKKLNHFANKWREGEPANRVKGFEPSMTKEDYIILRPKGRTLDTPAVITDIYPLGFQCTRANCLVYINAYDEAFSGVCNRCQGPLRQMKWVWFHLCGKLEYLRPLKDKRCRVHGQKFLYLHDTGRFSKSTWRCRECSSVDVSLGMIPCTECTSQLTPEELARKNNFFQGSQWNDSWVYYSQTISFVNLENSKTNDIANSKDVSELVIDALTGEVEAGGLRLSNRVNTLVKCTSGCGAEVEKSAIFCSQCGQKQDRPQRSGLKPDIIPVEALGSDGALITFATLRDMERTMSAADAVKQQKLGGKMSEAYTIAAAAPEMESAGINDILLLKDFPYTAAAVGYSRFKSGPPAWLNPFPSPEDYETKVPIYTNCSTSEAWMIKLSAQAVLKWVILNEFLPASYLEGAKGLDEAESWSWLLVRLGTDNPSAEDAELYARIYPLLHSYAHLMLQLLGTTTGLDTGSLGEMILPGALSFIIFAGQTDVGGLSAAFTQSLQVIASEIGDFMRVCKFDPSCNTDDGGVCVGCLYTSRGCEDFNNALSRSYLFGGNINIEGETKIVRTGYIDLI